MVYLRRLLLRKRRRRRRRSWLLLLLLLLLDLRLWWWHRQLLLRLKLRGSRRIRLLRIWLPARARHPLGLEGPRQVGVPRRPQRCSRRPDILRRCCTPAQMQVRVTTQVQCAENCTFQQRQVRGS